MKRFLITLEVTSPRDIRFPNINQQITDAVMRLLTKSKRIAPDEPLAITEAKITQSKRSIEEVYIMAPGQWENSFGPKDWFAIGTDTDGIVAYAMTEEIAEQIHSGFV